MKRITAVLLTAALCFTLCACGSNPKPTEVALEQKEEAETLTQAAVQAEEEISEAAQESPESGAEDDGIVDESQIRPEVKAFLDSYEEFMDEYIEFMTTYSSSSNPVGMMAQYNEIMQKYVSFSQEIEKYDNSNLSNAEMAYYIEVTSRVEQKLIMSIPNN